MTTESMVIRRAEIDDANAVREAIRIVESENRFSMARILD